MSITAEPGRKASPYTDLRDWLQAVDALGELRHVEGASWEEDIGRIAEMLHHTEESPAVLFDAIPGYPGGTASSSTPSAGAGGSPSPSASIPNSARSSSSTPGRTAWDDSTPCPSGRSDPGPSSKTSWKARTSTCSGSPRPGGTPSTEDATSGPGWPTSPGIPTRAGSTSGRTG